MGQLTAAGGVVVRAPEGRGSLVELPADAAGTRLGALATLGVEHGSAALTPGHTHTRNPLMIVHSNPVWALLHCVSWDTAASLA